VEGMHNDAYWLAGPLFVHDGIESPHIMGHSDCVYWSFQPAVDEPAVSLFLRHPLASAFSSEPELTLCWPARASLVVCEDSEASWCSRYVQHRGACML
jgi:hypothetical protein